MKNIIRLVVGNSIADHLAKLTLWRIRCYLLEYRSLESSYPPGIQIFGIQDLFLVLLLNTKASRNTELIPWNPLEYWSVESRTYSLLFLIPWNNGLWNSGLISPYPLKYRSVGSGTYSSLSLRIPVFGIQDLFLVIWNSGIIWNSRFIPCYPLEHMSIESRTHSSVSPEILVCEIQDLFLVTHWNTGFISSYPPKYPSFIFMT